jgi:uncharacterized secreted repeat protein (TIGR03808 family)
MPSRRDILVSMLSTGAAALAARPAAAQAPALRGPIDGAVDAQSLGARPGSPDDQTRRLQQMLDQAAAQRRALFLPPGRYVVSGLTLPSGTQLVGAPGATRLVHRGGGFLLRSDGAERLSIANIVLDGDGRALRERSEGLLHVTRCRSVAIDGIEVTNTPGSGVVLEGCGGRIERSTVTVAGETGIRAQDSRGLSIERNTISGIGNNAVQVWRSDAGEDGTLVIGNRIENVRSAGGGNGQNGNGVNVFRAGGVVVAQNRIESCAFSAIRNNAGANCQILGNSVRRLGEVAIFVEFGFQGAIIASNMVDAAAAGISVTNFNEGGRLAVVQGNVVRNLTARSPVNPDTRPYGIAAEADCAMTGNVVEESPGVGLLLGWGPYLRNVAATGNVVRRADIGIAVSMAQGAGRAIVTDNIIAEVRRGALLGMEWERVTTRDLGRESEGTHANLTYGRNVVS